MALLAELSAGISQGTVSAILEHLSARKRRRVVDVALRVFAEVEVTADPNDDSLAIVLLKVRKRSKALRKLEFRDAARLIELMNNELRRLSPQKVTLSDPIVAELLSLPANDSE